MEMNKYTTFQLILDLFVAIGTVAVAILAIWGDWFRDKLVAPKLIIQLKDSQGHLTTLQNGQKAIYYHLTIINKRKWVIARGVQVMLEGVWLKAADGTFKAESLASELPLVWTFPQFSPLAPNISDQKNCDFGHLSENEMVFKPELYIIPNNFRGYVTPNQTVRYSLRVKAENFTSGKTIVFEVSWDGNWSNDMAEMERHLVVKEIDEERF
jgi:hypothetical protein